MTTITTTPPATAAPPTHRPRALTAWLTVLFAVMAIGVAAFVWQFLNGLVVTGMRNTVMWGQYILFFMFFIGLSAGGLIVASAGRPFGATMSSCGPWSSGAWGASTSGTTSWRSWAACWAPSSRWRRSWCWRST